jgi:hypothetical protein
MTHNHEQKPIHFLNCFDSLKGGNNMKFKGNLGMTLLAAWLIITGVNALVDLSIPSFSVIMGALAIASGVLLIMRK